MQNHLQTEIKTSMIKTEAQIKVDNYFNSGTQKKGLLLYGPNGTGKSTSMREHTKAMWKKTAIEFASEIASHGSECVYKYSMHNMYIDDLGRERTHVTHYGDKGITPLHDLIHFRYEVFINTGYKTHISTNLSFNELTERYGLQIADRIKEMCEVVVFNGESLRV